MSRKKMFIENIFVYGLSNVLNKMVPFILLPIITRMLPNASDYGFFNMYSLTIGFATPLAVLGIYDAMFREYFEKSSEQYKYDVTVTGRKIVLVTSIIIAAICIILSSELSKLFFGISDYNNIVILAGIGVLFSANKSPAQVPTRMENKKKTFLFTGLISSVLAYGVALLLINFGYSYYGLIYSSMLAEIFLVLFFTYSNRTFFKKGQYDKNIAKELFRIGLPLLPTFLIYWIYSSADKIMITNMLGVTELGVYSIGAKIAQVSQLIYAGFAGGFAYFKYKTMNDEDQILMNSRLFEYLGVISFCIFALFLPVTKLVFEILFVGEYVNGFIVAPYLFLSPLLLMLFQVSSTQFIIIRKSYISSVTLLIGAVLNIVLNFLLINLIGIEGAAISTFVGYTISVITVTYIAYQKKLIVISKRLIVVACIMIMYIILFRLVLGQNLIGNLLALSIFFSVVIYNYRIESRRIASGSYSWIRRFRNDR